MILLLLQKILCKILIWISSYGTSLETSLILIANSLLIGFLLYYAITLLVSHLTVSNHVSPLSFIFKTIIIAITINSSYFVCEQILDINSLISSAIREMGEHILNKNICFSGLTTEINNIVSIEKTSFNIFSLNGLLKSFISFGLFNLVFSYSLRYVLLKVMILISPFAFLTLVHDKTSWFFKSWFKSLLSLLFIQIFISFVLLITFSITPSSDLFSNLIYVGCIYTLMKSNSFVRELMGGFSTSVQTSISNFIRT